MNYKIIKKISTADEIIKEITLSQAGYKKIEENRQEIKNILAGKDKRLLIVVGPCSAWPNTAVLEYAKRLHQLDKKVKHAVKLVMRVYIQKPRTTKGWSGPVNQPDPCAYPDIEAGIRYARNMMVEITKMGLAIADEALFTHNARGFIELLSWVAIGARSAEDQEHRIFASAIDSAVGLKNPTHGSLKVGINSIIAAQYPHVAAFDGNEVQTQGNPYAHLVLRGSQQGPNYSLAHLENVREMMQQHNIRNPSIMIDVSHDNCLVNGKKEPNRQPQIVRDVLQSIKSRPELRQLVKGFMLESFIKEGNQKVNPDKPEQIDKQGLSITDPCLGWEQTEDLLLQLAKEVCPV